MSKTIEEKLAQGRQYRSMEVRAADDAAEENMIVEGYATTFNQPYLLWRSGDYEVWEQIDAHAFDGCDMSDVIMQFDHEGRVFARNKNNTLYLTIKDAGLHVRAVLNGTELGKQVYSEVKGGYLNKMSFGFTVGEEKREVTENNTDNSVKVMRTITKVEKLYDVSVVSIPANDNTSIQSARNFGEGVIAEIQEEIRKAAEEAANKRAAISRIRILSEV